MIADFDARRAVTLSARGTRPPTAIVESADAERAGSGKLAARVARRIERDIVAAGWPVGQALGSEAELRARYGVSRAVLREAIRLLEHHQVAAMRRGPAGGLVVRAPDAGAATSAMVVYLEFVGSTIEHLLAARLVIEPLAVGLAAERITEAGISTLRAALADEAAAGPGRNVAVRDQLHLTIAELSGNPALRLFVDVLLRLTWRYARETLDDPPPEAGSALAEAHQAHQAMVHAVVSGDAARAEMHAARHLESIRDHVLEHSPDPKGQRPRWTMPAAGHTQDQKLAEVVAQRILSEITGGGWPIGSVIGSEAALLERFEVSRAVLREAVRLLEYHSVARMRRGPGGGLVVAEPDPSASIEAMALYLDYQGIEIDHLRVVREAVELDCVQRVASRVDDAEVAGRLRGLTRPGGAADGVNGVHPGPGGDRQHYRMHLEMAEQAGNPVLALFLRILLTLWARQQNDGPGADPADTTTGLAHDGIVDALLRGDRDLARHRMRRHLDALTRWWQ